MEWSWEGLVEDSVASCWCPDLAGRPQGVFTPHEVLQVVPCFALVPVQGCACCWGGGMGLNQARFGRYFWLC